MGHVPVGDRSTLTSSHSENTDQHFNGFTFFLPPPVTLLNIIRITQSLSERLIF